MHSISKQHITTLPGTVCEPSAWHQVTQAQIDDFADVTYDHQFIHVDPEQAATTEFGSTIAHGFLSLSLLSHFAKEFAINIDGTKIGINYGFDKVRFLNPVKVGAKIRALSEIVEVTEKDSDKVLLKYKITLEIEGESLPALIAEWLVLLVQ